MYYVYALSHPITKVVFYVGMTNNLYRRFKEHLDGRVITNERKNEYILHMRDIGLIPSVAVLETTATEGEAKDREYYWICHYKNSGVTLLNIMDYSTAHKYNPFTTKLEILRRQRGLSTRQLAALAKVKPNTISDIENGKTKFPKRATMESLAKALGVSLEDLADEMPEPHHSAVPAA